MVGVHHGTGTMIFPDTSIVLPTLAQILALGTVPIFAASRRDPILLYNGATTGQWNFAKDGPTIYFPAVNNASAGWYIAVSTSFWVRSAGVAGGGAGGPSGYGNGGGGGGTGARNITGELVQLIPGRTYYHYTGGAAAYPGTTGNPTYFQWAGIQNYMLVYGGGAGVNNGPYTGAYGAGGANGVGANGIAGVRGGDHGFWYPEGGYDDGYAGSGGGGGDGNWGGAGSPGAAGGRGGQAGQYPITDGGGQGGRGGGSYGYGGGGGGSQDLNHNDYNPGSGGGPGVGWMTFVSF